MATPTYTTIAENPNSTVVAEYVPDKKNATQYQSENELEQEFIRLLQTNGYEYITIRNNNDLIQNLRLQLSRLNHMVFSEAEWQQILKYLANKNEGIEEKTAKIQEDYIYNLNRDDGTTKNIRILDKDNIHNNSVQVINQYEAEGVHKNRYDVTVLVNGLPMVHVELKRRGVAIREAFNQINRYQGHSFWADSGLFQYLQLFVISNGTHTKYYSNTTRRALKEQAGKNSGKKTSNSFEFTSWWTDAKNKRISDLIDFAKTFFSKHSLLSVLTRYVNRLFWCLLLQFMEDLSDRELEKFLTENVAGRWFCGFMLNEDTPDHTVFTRARAKIGTDLLATLFQELRNQLKKQGYMNEVFTFVDASHLIAKANLWLFIVLLSKGHKAFN